MTTEVGRDAVLMLAVTGDTVRPVQTVRNDLPGVCLRQFPLTCDDRRALAQRTRSGIWHPDRQLALPTQADHPASGHRDYRPLAAFSAAALAASWAARAEASATPRSM